MGCSNVTRSVAASRRFPENLSPTLAADERCPSARLFAQRGRCVGGLGGVRSRPSMKRLVAAFVAVAGSCLGTTAPAGSAEVPDESAVPVYMLVLGRRPSPAEAAGSGRGDAAEQVAALKQRLVNDPAEAAAVARRASRDAMGRPAHADEIAAVRDRPQTYSELMQGHVAVLAARPDEHVEMIRRAYPLVVGRTAYPEEIEYWRKGGPLPFVLVVACLDNWARRNQPGLMVTGGVPTVARHCSYLETARVRSSSVTTLRAAVSLEAAAVASGGVLAAGGSRLQTDGGMALVAVGNDRLSSGISP